HRVAHALDRDGIADGDIGEVEAGRFDEQTQAVTRRPRALDSPDRCDDPRKHQEENRAVMRQSSPIARTSMMRGRSASSRRVHSGNAKTACALSPRITGAT